MYSFTHLLILIQLNHSSMYLGVGRSHSYRTPACPEHWVGCKAGLRSAGKPRMRNQWGLASLPCRANCQKHMWSFRSFWSQCPQVQVGSAPVSAPRFDTRSCAEFSVPAWGDLILSQARILETTCRFFLQLLGEYYETRKRWSLREYFKKTKTCLFCISVRNCDLRRAEKNNRHPNKINRNLANRYNPNNAN